MLDFSSTIKMECPLLVHLLVPLYLVSETKNVLLSQSIFDHKSCKVGFMFFTMCACVRVYTCDICVYIFTIPSIYTIHSGR